MKASIRALCGLGLVAAASAVHAQSAPTDPCPHLPADSGLTWEYKQAGETQFCRALRADGSEAFGLYIAKDSPFAPARGKRAEEASIDGRATHWYKTEIAARPDVRARETLVRLPNGRVAYLWIQAASDAQLGESIARANSLRFGTGAQLSSK